MEDIEFVDPEYVKGFNEGYTIRQHLPELADQLAEKVGDSMRSAGFKDGREQYILERERERYPKWLRSDRLSSLEEIEAKQREKDKDRDKDDRYPSQKHLLG